MLRNFIISYPQPVPLRQILLSQVNKVSLWHYCSTNLFSLLPGKTVRPKFPDPLAIRCGHVHHLQAWLIPTSWEIVYFLSSVISQVGVEDQGDGAFVFVIHDGPRDHSWVCANEVTHYGHADSFSWPLAMGKNNHGVRRWKF